MCFCVLTCIESEIGTGGISLGGTVPPNEGVPCPTDFYFISGVYL